MNRSLRTKCWEKFLAFKGYRHVRTKASHYIWTKQGSPRPIPVWGDEKDVPGFHLRTGCKTIGCELSELYEWAAENC